MAIVKMSEFELYAFNDQREKLLKALQKFNFVHFEKISSPDENPKENKTSTKVTEVREELERVKYALKLLFNYDERPKGLKKMMEGNPNINFEELETMVKESNWEKIYEEVKVINDHLEELKLKETKIRSELEEVESWTNLDISPKVIGRIKSIRGMLGTVPKKFESELLEKATALKLSYIEKVGEGKSDSYFMVLTDKDEENELMEILRSSSYSEVRLDIDEEPVKLKQRLNKEIVDLKKEEQETKDKLKKVAPDIKKLEMAYEYLENKLNRAEAEGNFLTTEYLEVIKGFIPQDKKDEFEKVIKDTLGESYSISYKKADKDDERVPVLLKNNKFIRSFESITNMYATPLYNEIDPTPFIAPFYMIFFGMMIGDAGYGLILLILTAIALKKFNLSKSMRNSIRFFHLLSYPTIMWGIIYGSYLSLDVPVKKLIDPAKDFMFLLGLAMAMGLIHLFTSLGIKAYMLIRDKKPMDAVYDVLLWYMALTGALVMLIGSAMNLNPTVLTIAKFVMIAGMVGIVLFAARDAAGWGGRIAGGLYSLYGISSWVGDIVSYSRLMALGLSGAFIGMAFNLIANMVNSAWYMIPAAVVIFFIGHAFNLFLSALGAYVHTLRLTYVESFGKFFSGGGVKFKPLRSDPKYVNYRDDMD